MSEKEKNEALEEELHISGGCGCQHCGDPLLLVFVYLHGVTVVDHGRKVGPVDVVVARAVRLRIPAGTNTSGAAPARAETTGFGILPAESPGD